MLDFPSAISTNNHPFYSKLTIYKLNSNKTEEKTVLTYGFNMEKMKEK